LFFDFVLSVRVSPDLRDWKVPPSKAFSRANPNVA